MLPQMCIGYCVLRVRICVEDSVIEYADSNSNSHIPVCPSPNCPEPLLPHVYTWRVYVA